MARVIRVGPADGSRASHSDLDDDDGVHDDDKDDTMLRSVDDAAMAKSLPRPLPIDDVKRVRRRSEHKRSAADKRHSVSRLAMSTSRHLHHHHHRADDSDTASSVPVLTRFFNAVVAPIARVVYEPLLREGDPPRQRARKIGVAALLPMAFLAVLMALFNLFYDGADEHTFSTSNISLARALAAAALAPVIIGWPIGYAVVYRSGVASVPIVAFDSLCLVLTVWGFTVTFHDFPLALAWLIVMALLLLLRAPAVTAWIFVALAGYAVSVYDDAMYVRTIVSSDAILIAIPDVLVRDTTARVVMGCVGLASSIVVIAALSSQLYALDQVLWKAEFTLDAALEVATLMETYDTQQAAELLDELAEDGHADAQLVSTLRGLVTNLDRFRPHLPNWLLPEFLHGGQLQGKDDDEADSKPFADPDDDDLSSISESHHSISRSGDGGANSRSPSTLAVPAAATTPGQGGSLDGSHSPTNGSSGRSTPRHQHGSHSHVTTAGLGGGRAGLLQRRSTMAALSGRGRAGLTDVAVALIDVVFPLPDAVLPPADVASLFRRGPGRASGGGPLSSSNNSSDNPKLGESGMGDPATVSPANSHNYINASHKAMDWAARTDALDTMVDDVYALARTCCAAVHSFVGDRVQLSWGAAVPCDGAHMKATRFLKLLRTHNWPTGVSVSGAADCGLAHVHVAGSKTLTAGHQQALTISAAGTWMDELRALAAGARAVRCVAASARLRARASTTYIMEPCLLTLFERPAAEAAMRLRNAEEAVHHLVTSMSGSGTLGMVASVIFDASSALKAGGDTASSPNSATSARRRSSTGAQTTLLSEAAAFKWKRLVGFAPTAEVDDGCADREWMYELERRGELGVSAPAPSSKGATGGLKKGRGRAGSVSALQRDDARKAYVLRGHPNAEALAKLLVRWAEPLAPDADDVDDAEEQPLQSAALVEAAVPLLFSLKNQQNGPTPLSNDTTTGVRSCADTLLDSLLRLWA